ncbi:methyltransferase [Actinomadura napierensis]|uniref:Methyltransferase n=1 Tax=Actinomadura napierensis TaxID=267854 RepID=A0ABN2ZY32_9ACTN
MTTEAVDSAPAPPPAGPGGPPPPGSLRLLRLLTGTWIAQSVHAVAELDVADRLAAGPRAVADLAAEAGADAGALFRVMRALVPPGVFEEPEPGVFALGELGEFLRSDVPGTQKYSALLFGAETFRSWAEVLHSVRTGEPAFPAVYGSSFYEYLDRHEKVAESFNRTMGAGGMVPPVARSFDFTGHRHVVDVGGGSGALLAAVLSWEPGLTGTLFDLPEAVAEPEAAITGPFSERCSIVTGSFFDEVPEGGDVYLLSRVLHNWNDADAGRILRNVRAAMRPGSRLLVFERLLPDAASEHIGALFDLVMLVVLGGRERTLHEYASLLEGAGLEVVRSADGPRDMGVIEARAV